MEDGILLCLFGPQSIGTVSYLAPCHLSDAPPRRGRSSNGIGPPQNYGETNRLGASLSAVLRSNGFSRAWTSHRWQQDPEASSAAGRGECGVGKAGSIVRLSSGLELDHAWDCELDSGVSQFFVQPLRMQYVFQGKSRADRPDALVVTADGLEIREVKHEEDASLPENTKRWPIIAELLNAAGISFRVVTDQTIRAPTRKGNVEYIRARRRCGVAPEHIVGALSDRTRIPWASPFLKYCHLQTDYRFTRRAAIRWGLLAVDLDLAPINDLTIVHSGPLHTRTDAP